jgi:Holliday junction resolvase RusA-like endonuclease
MQLVVDPEPSKDKSRGRGRNQKKLVWIFEPESFERCRNCGAKTIKTQNAKTDLQGRVKLHIASKSLNSLSFEDDLTIEDDNV